MTVDVFEIDTEHAPLIRDCLQRRERELNKRLWNAGQNSPRNQAMRAERKQIVEVIGKLPELE